MSGAGEKQPPKHWPGFNDHFSGHSKLYAQFRPGYPKKLFAFVASHAPAKERAWDCATGPGQAARGLAEHFSEVIATDASAEQLAQAEPHPRVTYAKAPAEASGLANASVDAVTVAQAVHWFDLDKFYAEARRVLRPGGVIAVWSYAFLNIEASIDAVVNAYYSETVGPYWPPQRKLVEDEYRSLPFPFAVLEAPRFTMSARWALPHLMGYLDSWSATQRYKRDKQHDPLPELYTRLAPLWGEPSAEKEVRWPLVFKAGRVNG